MYNMNLPVAQVRKAEIPLSETVVPTTGFPRMCLFCLYLTFALVFESVKAGSASSRKANIA